MKRSTKIIGVVALLAMLANFTQAGTIFVQQVSTGVNSYDVFLSDITKSPPDAPTQGIASYGLPITGVTISIDHRSPWTPFAQDGAFVGGEAGFSFLRSADNVALVGASQNTITPTPHIILGFGQVGGSFAGEGLNPLGGAPDGIAWNSPLLVASVVFDPAGGPSVVDIAQASGAFVNIFNESGGIEAAELIPEPGTLVLAGLSLIGIFTSRRRLT